VDSPTVNHTNQAMDTKMQTTHNQSGSRTGIIGSSGQSGSPMTYPPVSPPPGAPVPRPRVVQRPVMRHCTSDNCLPLARALGAEQPLNRNRLDERTTGEGPAARLAGGLRGRANLKGGPCLEEDPFHHLLLVYRPFVKRMWSSRDQYHVASSRVPQGPPPAPLHPPALRLSRSQRLCPPDPSHTALYDAEWVPGSSTSCGPSAPKSGDRRSARTVVLITLDQLPVYWDRP